MLIDLVDRPRFAHFRGINPHIRATAETGELDMHTVDVLLMYADRCDAAAPGYPDELLRSTVEKNGRDARELAEWARAQVMAAAEAKQPAT